MKGKCRNGHPASQAFLDSLGRRQCRQCRKDASARYAADPGGRVTNVKRLQDWLVAWLGDHDVTGRALAEKVGVHERVIYAICTGERKYVNLDTLDGILCATGQPGLLGCFFSPNGGRLEPLPPPRNRPRRNAIPAGRCRSGDRCPRRDGHGPDGRFCVHHGAELDRIAEVINPQGKKARDHQRRAFAKGQGGREVRV